MAVRQRRPFQARRNPLKNTLRIAFSVACVSAFTQACAFHRQSEPDTRVADEAAIRQTDIAWSKTGETRNVDAMMASYTEDAVMLAQDMALVTGKAEIRQALDRLYATPGFSAKWQPVHVEVARSGEISYVRGIVEAKTLDSKGLPFTQKGSTSRSGKSKLTAPGSVRLTCSTSMDRQSQNRFRQKHKLREVYPVCTM